MHVKPTREDLLKLKKLAAFMETMGELNEEFDPADELLEIGYPKHFYCFDDMCSDVMEWVANVEAVVKSNLADELARQDYELNYCGDPSNIMDLLRHKQSSPGYGDMPYHELVDAAFDAGIIEGNKI